MDIAEIKISEPIFLKDEDYLCKLTQNDNDILINVDITPSILNFIYGTSEYLVLNNNDIKVMKQIYDKAVDLVHENTEEWFENKLELADVKNAFVPFIVPDIENNCLGVKCGLNEDVEYNKDEKYDSVTLKVAGVVLNSNSFKINLVLDKLNKVEEKEEQSELVEKVQQEEEQKEEQKEEQQEEQEQEQELHTETQNELVSETQKIEEENIQEENQENVEENLVLPSDELDELTEVDFTNDNLDKLEMSIEKDNLFLYYDIINDKIKENMYYSLENILKKRNFKNNNFDIEEILFDDETVNDEDDYMNESDNEMTI